MVPQWLFTAMLELLTFFLSLLPDSTLSLPSIVGYGTMVGSMAGPLNAVLPVAEVAATIVLTLTVVAPALFLYRLILWVWARIPVVGGGS